MLILHLGTADFLIVRRSHSPLQSEKIQYTMANTNHEEETRTSIDEVNDTLTGLGERVQKNPKTIMYACVAVAAVVIAVLVYVYAVRQPGIQSANDALGQADIELLMGNDSIALAKYQQVADNHGYKAGELAGLNAAILLYKDKKYEEAINTSTVILHPNQSSAQGQRALRVTAMSTLRSMPRHLTASRKRSACLTAIPPTHRHSCSRRQPCSAR